MPRPTLRLQARWRAVVLASVAVVVACGPGSDPGVGPENGNPTRLLPTEVYADKVRGGWQATMVANHSGLDLQGIWLAEPGPGDRVDLLFPEQWSTDDDTHVEWLDLHILETHGLDPTAEEIRDEWVDHLNHDIWVATRRARDLMDDGLLPPETGAAAHNPDGVWSIDAQLQTELFGLLSPGLPDQARTRATRFARITNSGLAVDVSAFYAHLYAEAFFEPDLDRLVDGALAAEPADSEVTTIVDQVRAWHGEEPDDWRRTRARIAERYDLDPEWWASRVNFAVTVMALMYGGGELETTIHIAALAGWDADNNMATAAGLLGVIAGFERLPASFRSSSDVYVNEDLTGGLPEVDSVSNIADRTVRLGGSVLASAGVRRTDAGHHVPVGD